MLTTRTFEMVDTETDAPAAAGKTPVTSVELGTPRTVVDAWNHDKLVSLVELNESKFCGAAIGTEVKSVARDFKACALPVSGENMCMAGPHQGPKTVRLTMPLGSSMFLAIATPQSKQVFSRPILEGADLRFLLQGSVHYERLLTIKMEPRVW